MKTIMLGNSNVSTVILTITFPQRPQPAAGSIPLLRIGKSVTAGCRNWGNRPPLAETYCAAVEVRERTALTQAST
jgi:hypothetical protein